MKVSEIFVYPIKSLGGISMKSCEVDSRGFKFDRRWMLIDSDGNFMTQRNYPKMALLKVELSIEGLFVKDKSGNLKPLFVPFENRFNHKTEVPIWNDKCEAVFVGKFADDWFGKVLNCNCRLVFMPDYVKRFVDKSYAFKNEIVSFADGFPFLLIGQASLDDLNSRLSEPLPINRFRPNIVFTGAEPFQEDSFSVIMINDLHFNVVKPCARCIITTTDQVTAERSAEPLKTLSTFRKSKNKVLFGMNLVHQNIGRISIGDDLIVLKYK